MAARASLALADLAVRGKDPLVFVQEFLALFNERLRDGAISRERACCML